jgi:hypothetical protein
MAAEFEQLERGSSVLYGASGGVWVMTLFAAPTKNDMLLARPALAAMSRRSPGGFATLTWVLPEAGFRMESDARTAAAEVTNEFTSVIRAQATLIEGAGFQVATVRAIVAGLDLMSRSAAPKRVFSELAPAIAWCVQYSPASASTLGVTSMTDALNATRKSLFAPSA